MWQNIQHTGGNVGTKKLFMQKQHTHVLIQSPKAPARTGMTCTVTVVQLHSPRYSREDAHTASKLSVTKHLRFSATAQFFYPLLTHLITRKRGAIVRWPVTYSTILMRVFVIQDRVSGGIKKTGQLSTYVPL